MNVLITGASKGIGRACAMHFASKGHHVIALSRDKALLESLQAAQPDFIEILCMDLEKLDEKEFKAFLKTQKSLDILINNAGYLINKDFSDTSMEDWVKTMNVNLLAAVQLSRLCTPLLRKSDDAHIVNISSMGGYQGSVKFRGLTAYSTAKGALSTFSECLSVELWEDDIVVNALCLGAVQTEMLEEAFPGLEAQISAEKMAKYIFDFAIKGRKFINGKVLPVSLQNPTA